MKTKMSKQSEKIRMAGKYSSSDVQRVLRECTKTFQHIYQLSKEIVDTAELAARDCEMLLEDDVLKTAQQRVEEMSRCSSYMVQALGALK